MVSIKYFLTKYKKTIFKSQDHRIKKHSRMANKKDA